VNHLGKLLQEVPVRSVLEFELVQLDTKRRQTHDSLECLQLVLLVQYHSPKLGVEDVLDHQLLLRECPELLILLVDLL